MSNEAPERTATPPTMRTATPSTLSGASPDANGQLLGRGLGVGSIVFMVVAVAAPLGVVAGNMPIIATGTAAVPVFFLAATAILLLFSVGFTRMGKHVPNAGAFYSYVHIGLGRTLGTGAATLALVAYTLLGVSVYAFLGASASAVIENGFGVAVPWWVCGFVAVALVGFLGYRDIELSAKVLAVLMCCEVAIVLVMDIAIIARGGDAGLNLLPFAPSTLAQSIAPATGLMFAFLSFIGFEATAVFRNEAKNPERTIPRATYIAVLGIGLFYTFSSWAVVMGAGVENSVAIASADPDNFSINLAREYVAPIAGDIMQVLLVTSWLACILSLHNVTTRYHFTLGGKGVLPKALAEVNAKHRSPSKASLATTAGAVVLVAIIAAAGLDPVSEGYAWLAGVSTLGIVALMTMTSLAVVLYFRRTHHPASAFIAPVISFIALLGVLGLTIANYPLLVGSTTAAVVLGGVTVLSFAAGIAIAQIMRVARPAKFATLGD